MSGIAILLNDHRGVYIPRDFVRNFTNWNGISEENKTIIEAGPTADLYWDAWQDMLDNATYTDENKNTWHLYQDGDLFAICYDLLTEEDKSNFGWDKD